MRGWGISSMQSCTLTKVGQSSLFRMRRKSRLQRFPKRIPWGCNQMAQAIMEEAVKIPPIGLSGDLMIPARATGVELFAHGSGSSRHSSRNRYVASFLQEGGLATLLLDLLTEAEEEVDLQTRHLRFDIGLLAGRLGEATDWLQYEPATRRLPVGYFGASTGGGAAPGGGAERAREVGGGG